MNRDTLYLLKTDFFDQGAGPFFCPGCVQLVGLLNSYPALREHLNVQYVDFPRPRPGLATLLGEENQSCPVLILEAVPPALPLSIKVQNANGRDFVEGASNIAEYLAHVHGIGVPYY